MVEERWFPGPAESNGEPSSEVLLTGYFQIFPACDYRNKSGKKGEIARKLRPHLKNDDASGGKAPQRQTRDNGVESGKLAQLWGKIAPRLLNWRSF